MSLFPVLPNREAYFPLVFWVPYVASAAGTATTTVVRVQLLTEVAFTKNRKVFCFRFCFLLSKKKRIREIKDFLSHLFLNFLVKHRRFFLELSVSTWFWNLGFGFPGGSVVKNLRNKQEMGSIPGLGDPLEKEMATHSSTLAWEIPQTEEPGGLQSMGSQRVGYNLVIKQQPIQRLSIFKNYLFIFNVIVCTRSLLQHVGSSSLTRVQTWARCIGSMKTQPLDHLGNPKIIYFLMKF